MPVSRHTYSFSGADARVFTYFDAAPSLIRPLDSVHTISISVHEAKGQARALGHRGAKGLARGVRTIAGSLILTVINDHPLKSLIDQYNESGRPDIQGWSLDRDLVGKGTLARSYDLNNLLSTLLPPFNLAIQYVSEGADYRVFDSITDDPAVDGDLVINKITTVGGAGLLLRHVEFVDDGLVTSTNDIVTEITLSFIALDYKPLASFAPADLEALGRNQYSRDSNVDIVSRILQATRTAEVSSGSDIRQGLNDLSAEQWADELLGLAGETDGRVRIPRVYTLNGASYGGGQ